MKLAIRISSIRRSVLKAVQVVLRGFGLEVTELVGQVCACGVDPLSVRLEDRGYRVLREPIDLQIGMKLA